MIVNSVGVIGGIFIDGKGPRKERKRQHALMKAIAN